MYDIFSTPNGSFTVPRDDCGCDRIWNDAIEAWIVVNAKDIKDGPAARTATYIGTITLDNAPR